MSKIGIADYGIFTDGISTVKKFNEAIESNRDIVTECTSKLGSESVFMGPICDSCKEGLKALDGKIGTMVSNFSLVANYLSTTATNYKGQDASAVKEFLSIDGNGAVKVETGSVVTGNIVSSVSIPSDIRQGGYSVTGYDRWIDTGSEMIWDSGTNQRAVADIWKQDGSRFKDGIAVVNVDGQDQYLVATAEDLGSVGDRINVKLENGQNIPCVVADAKSTADANITQYGHLQEDGSVNVLEFQVQRDAFLQHGCNPATDSWGLEWDSTSRVTDVDNYGSII